MAGSAYISYQLGNDAPPSIQITSRPRVPPSDSSVSAPEKTKQTSQQASTSFVLVDPSTPSDGVDARKNIRKHASKACAAQRLATIAAKKKSHNVRTKRERQRQQAADRLQAALQQHAEKLASSDLAFKSLANLQSSEGANPDERYVRKTSPIQVTPLHLIAGEPTVVPSHREPPSAELDHQRSTISWTLSSPSPLFTSTQEIVQQYSPITTIIHPVPSPPISRMYSTRLDPFSTFPVDLHDDGTLSPLFSFLQNSVYPMMDLRLPSKLDRMAGTRYAHSNELPHLVLSSEPLFWTMALCAATLFSLRNRQREQSDPTMMGYRYMAIRSVNQRLSSLGEDSIYDVGLIYAIASLGVWEREVGSKEVWRSHRQGVEMLCQRLRRGRQHHLLPYIVQACDTPSAAPSRYDVSEGFGRVCDRYGLDRTLVSAVYECAHLDKLPRRDPCTTECIQSTTSKLLSFRPSDAVSRTLCGNQARGIEGDRRFLELHVLLQGAGASLINCIEKNQVIPDIEMIDFDEMCREAVGLARSVAHEPAYDELLYWSMFTIFASARYAEIGGLEIVNKVGQRLEMREWRQVEMSLRTSVYLESLDHVYKEYWAVLQRHILSTGCCF